MQTAAVALIVAAAGAYLARYAWRAWQGKRSGCHCGQGACTKPR